MDVTFLIITYHTPYAPDGRLLVERCVSSLKRHESGAKIFVGANQIDGSDEGRVQGKWTAPRAYLEKSATEGTIETLIIAKDNIGKEGMLEMLLHRVETEFVIIIDDDTHFHAPFLEELEWEISFDTEKQIAEWGRIPANISVAKDNMQTPFATSLGATTIRKQLWFKSKPMFGVPSVSGGFVCARMSALRSVNYPECTKDFPLYAEDTILGMALYQNDWLVRNVPMFWSRKIVSFGDAPPRTDRTQPRKVWDGDIRGIEIHKKGMVIGAITGGMVERTTTPMSFKENNLQVIEGGT